MQNCRELAEAINVITAPDGKTTVNVKGNNLPAQGFKVKLPEANAHTMVTAMEEGKTDVQSGAVIPKLKDIADTIAPEFLKRSVLDNIKDPKVKAAVEKKLDKDVLVKIRESLTKDAKTKPTLVIVGRASMEGNLSDNKDLAKKRAESYKKRLEADNDVKGAFNFEVKGIVVGPDGKDITDLNKAWADLAELWNAKFNLTGDKKLDVNKLKKRMSARDLNAAENAFVKEHFDNNRGVGLSVLPPKEKQQDYDVTFESNTSQLLTQRQSAGATPPAQRPA
jgi:hypothetical protein